MSSSIRRLVIVVGAFALPATATAQATISGRVTGDGGAPVVGASVFLEGRPIGSQTIEAQDFSARREFETGSWLGAPHQGHGLGTEQRAAVLELGFRGLGAHAAVSGSIVHNISSQRVSEKLGYRVTGMRKIAPRGEPVDHYDYRLDRAEWSCPIPVDLDGLAPSLPLFGAVTRSS